MASSTDSLLTSNLKTYLNFIQIINDNNNSLNEFLGEQNIWLTFTGCVITLRTAYDRNEEDYN